MNFLKYTHIYFILGQEILKYFLKDERGNQLVKYVLNYFYLQRAKDETNLILG